MTSKKDISNMEDIQLLVNNFYSKVQKDDLIGEIFNQKIGNNWEFHLQKMYTFWQTLLLDERTYHVMMMSPGAWFVIFSCI